MKKSTKFVSLLLAVMLTVSTFAGIAVFPVSAGEGGEQRVYFRFPDESVWTHKGLKNDPRSGKANVFCYAYAIYGNSKPYALGWKTRTTQCYFVKDDPTLYYFDLNSIEDKGPIEDGADYGIIFSTGAAGQNQTCDLNLTTECIGHTVIVTPFNGVVDRENAADSNKRDHYATWEGMSDPYGPKATISSLGALMPGYFPANQPHAQQLSNSLKQYLTNPKNNPCFQYENNMKLCEALKVTPQEVYDQYLADNKDNIKGEPETDKSVPCPFYRYMYINDQEKLVEGKLAAPEYVREVLGISDEEPTTEPVVTEEPTTEPVVTEEPTTEPVATEEPTTEPVATEEPTTEPVAASTYTVAGSSAAIFNGTAWDASNEANDMTFNEATGLYEITYPNVQPEDAIQLKVVKDHGWDESYPEQNVSFNVKEACDVKVTYNPETNEVLVSGTGVTFEDDLKPYSIIAVGNGEDTYLNGANWDPCDPANAMTEVADGIWEMTMEDIYAFGNYQVKFAVNSVDKEGNPTSNPWAHNFGSEEETHYPVNTELDAFYNGKNCLFEVEEDASTVKLQLDLRNFDFKTMTGAKMTITVTAPEPQAEGTIGDVNKDGQVDAIDAMLIQQVAIGKTPNSIFSNKLADVNNDGVINVLDASCVQRYAAGMTKKTGNAGVAYEDITPVSDDPQIME